MLCHQADYLSAALLEPGERVSSDWHNALKLGFDVSHGALCYPEWMFALLLEAGPVGRTLTADALPRVVRPGEPIGSVGERAAARWGLPRTCLVCGGTTDSNAAFLAATGGVCSAGTAVSSLGSTIALKLLSDVRVDDAALGLYSHRLGESWLVGGASNSGCAVLREHFTDARLAELSLLIDPEIERDLGYVPLRAGTLGERFPAPSADAVQRLAPRPPDDAHFLHAILDSLARVEARGYALLAERGAGPPHTILTCGGGAANEQFTRIRSRVLPVPAVCARTMEASVGVALLALSEGAIGG
ncbi:carbohydrate kinase [Pavlovales sp. CCMP2436]|nr:carbohydrate kinase [Pavlovales sp. CCMP2436]